MATYTVVRLHNFKGGLHLSRGLTNSYDKSLQTLHSDTLKSAIFVNALYLDENLGKAGIKSDYSDSPGKAFLDSFKISSAFPFYKSPNIERTEPFYFFPKPERPRLFKDDYVGMEKKLKKIRFLEKSSYETYLTKQSNFGDIKEEHIIGAFFTSSDEFKTVKDVDNCESIMTSEAYQHVTIPRDHATDSTPYYVDKIYFHKNAGLFFLLDAKGETLNKVKSALKLLEDNGIGTDRNNGNGQFEVEFSEMELNVPTDGTHDVSLSLYCPTKEEIEGKIDQCYYQLAKRGGYISSPEQEIHLSIRKRSIYMFTEGSIFPYDANRTGKLVNLNPNSEALEAKQITIKHPIWRDGQAIFVPMKLEENAK